MSTRCTLTVLTACAALLQPARGPLEVRSSSDSIEVGTLAPALGCADSGGSQIEWDDFAGKAVILQFHSSLTTNSDKALADLASSVGADAALGERVAMVVVGTEAEEPQIAARLESVGCELRIARAPDRGPNLRYGVIAYPTAFVIDRERKVVDVVRGYGTLFAWRVATAARLAAGLIDAEEYERIRSGSRSTSAADANRSSRTLQLARRLIAAGKLDMARAGLEQAVTNEAEPGPATRLLVRFLLAEGEVEEAAGWVERLVESSPDDLGLAPARARIAVAGGDVAAAEELLAPLDPDDPEVRLVRGLILERGEKWPEAAAAYRETLERMLLLSE